MTSYFSSLLLVRVSGLWHPYYIIHKIAWSIPLKSTLQCYDLSRYPVCSRQCKIEEIRSCSLRVQRAIRPRQTQEEPVTKPSKIYLNKASQFLKRFERLYRVFSPTWPASMQIYCNKRKRLHEKRVQYPRGLVRDTNMAAVSLLWDTNMAAVTSRENTLYWHRVVL